MNYLRAYNILIENAQDRGRPDGYCEKHHILPKCMGGRNSKDNIVYLTAKEHFLCHKMLVRIFPEIKGNWYALVAMGRIAEYKSRVTAQERERAYFVRVGFRYSEESRKKMRDSALKRGVHPNMVDTQFGKKPPWNKGLKDWRKGYSHSPEVRARIRATNVLTARRKRLEAMGQNDLV